MNLIVDTHIFLWFVTGDKGLGQARRDAICDPSNLVFVSSVSAAEIASKRSIGKLELPGSPEEYVPRLRKEHHFLELPLGEAPSLLLANLPPLHKDPFDRLLVCQSLSHNLPLITDDRLILQYDVPTL